MSPGPGRGTPDEKWPEHRPGGAAENQPVEATPKTPGGTPHGDPLKRSAIHGKGDAPSNLTPHSRPDGEWQRAEQISESSIVQKDKVAATGSEGLAKQQADTAAQRAESGQTHPAAPTSQREAGANSASANPQAGGPPSPAAGIDPRAETQAGLRSHGGSSATAAYPAGKANSKDDLAQKLGFPSFLEFFEGSQPFSSEQNNVWYTSALPQNQWVLWNSQTLEYSRPFATREQAKQANNVTR